MRITKRYLSLPPFLSTSWRHVSSIRLESGSSGEDPVLVVMLTDGLQVEVPHLNDTVIEAIFAAHESYLEGSTEESSKEVARGEGGGAGLSHNPFAALGGLLPEQMVSLPLKLGPGGFEGGLEHTPEQAGMPDLPPELLEKVGSIAKALGVEEAMEIGPAVEGCNCFHCQLARAMGGVETACPQAVAEEAVSDEDLRFRNWDISEEGEHLYTVVNPGDPTECYSVYLGKPIGCTCGHDNCEHIRAVLNS